MDQDQEPQKIGPDLLYKGLHKSLDELVQVLINHWLLDARHRYFSYLVCRIDPLFIC